MNLNFAQKILNQLLDIGVGEVCLCPGGRNAPFVELFSRSNCPFRVRSFYDERSAGFYAQSRALKLKSPVAVFTTSGTAVSELLSPVIEAFYSGSPLIVVSSDRPKKYRGTGAPQAIRQNLLLRDYCFETFDFETEGKINLETWDGKSPIHINMCFDEPLLSGRIQEYTSFQTRIQTQKQHHLFLQGQENKISEFLDSFHKPLCIVSGIPDEENRTLVKDFLLRIQQPCYFELTSGLAADADLEQFKIAKDEIFFRSSLFTKNFDSIIRIGRIPISRLWRELEQKLEQLMVLSISDLGFSGLARESFSQTQSFNQLRQILPNIRKKNQSLLNLTEINFEFNTRIKNLIQKYPKSEPALIAKLSTLVKKEESIYLGNSLPIRTWDQFSQSECTNIFCNRGANGIDGQISSFFGSSSSHQTNWAIIGDLTCLYDMSGFWSFDLDQCHRIVVINNFGGQIFSRMFDSKLFLNQHQLSFEHLAKMWSMNHCRMEEDLPQLVGSKQLIEVVPCSEQSHLFWKEIESGGE